MNKKYLESEFKRIVCGVLAKTVSDKKFIEMMYKRQIGDKLDLNNPKRFTEKMQWMKLFYRDNDIPICSDKYESINYLKRFGYEYLKPKIIAVYENADDLDVSILPDKFALKATHGSGWNIICKDKSRFDPIYAKQMMKTWLKQNLYVYGREWNYRYQKPRIIIEEYINCENLVDYKFMCYNGKAEFMQINHDEDGVHCVDFYDINWKRMPEMSCGVYPKAKRDLPKPDNFDEMLEISETMAKQFPFVRVDLYDVGRLYFGELTFFPGSGFWNVSPVSYDELLGSRLNLPEPNNNLELYQRIMS